MKEQNKSNKIRKRVDKITWSGQRSLFYAVGIEFASYLLRFKCCRYFVNLVSPQIKVENVVFLCGCFNSGTTILRDILGSHPEINIIPREGVVYTTRLSDYETNQWARYWSGLDGIKSVNRTEFKKLKQSDLLSDWRFWLPKNGWFLEKSIANIGRMVELQDIFPAARFIIIERDPLPVAEGITRRTKSLVTDPSSEYTDSMAVDQWLLCRELITQQADGLKYCHRLSYESFVSDPAMEINKILEFLELNPSASYNDSGLNIAGFTWRIRNGNPSSYKALSEDRIAEMDRRLRKHVG